MESTVTPVSPAAVKPRVRISTTPEERAEWVRLFEESGKSATQFCQELGLAETTFAVWRWQVREAANAEAITFTDVPFAVASEQPTGQSKGSGQPTGSGLTSLIS